MTMTLPDKAARRKGTTRSSAAKMLPFVLMRRDVARGTERCIGVGHIYDQYEEAKQPLERRKLHRTFRKVVCLASSCIEYCLCTKKSSSGGCREPKVFLVLRKDGDIWPYFLDCYRDVNV